jgi:hypothetical protein
MARRSHYVGAYGLVHMLNPEWNLLGLFNVGLFGLVACLLPPALSERLELRWLATPS